MSRQFTKRAERVISIAQDEAKRLNHDYVGTEHILLGLLDLSDGVAKQVLAQLSVDPLSLRANIEKIIGIGDNLMLMGEIPFTPRAKMVLEFAVEESHNMGHFHVGTEHLLLGLIHEEESAAAQVLKSLGVHLDNVREQVIHLSDQERASSESTQMKIYLNGHFVEKEKAVVSVFDHGLLYGDGVFEGIRAYSGRVFKLAEHLDRLYNSARAIMLAIPLSKTEMQEAVRQTLRANQLTDAYVRLVVTRGVGDLGLDPRKCPHPTIFIIADKISLYPQEYYENGLSLITSSVRRNIPDALSPSIKSLNYLNNVIAKAEASRQNAPEAIMLNREGYVAECTGDNIFLIKGGQLVTPPGWAGALDGITRGVVIEIAKNDLQMPVREEIFTPYHLYVADEVFLTGTAAEVVPVKEVDGRLIGDGKPGKATRQLMQKFRELTQKSGIPIENL